MPGHTTAYEIAYRSFVLVQEFWSLVRALQVVRRLQPTHVVVKRRDSDGRYHLYTRQEFEARAAGHRGTSTVGEGIGVRGQDTTALVGGDTPASAAPSICVVEVDGYVVGFIDHDMRPPHNQGRGRSRSRRHVLPEANASRGVAAPTDRSLVAELPGELVVGKVTSLLVYVSAIQASDVTALAIPGLPPASSIHVIILPKQGVVVDGDSEGTLTIADEEQTLSLRFALRATRVGPVEIEVLAFKGAQPLGMLKLTPVAFEHAGDDGERVGKRQPMAPVTVRQPDLAMLILERTDSGGRRLLELLLSAADPTLRLSYRRFGPVALETNAHAYFEEFFKGIEGLALDTPAARAAAERRLAAKGANLFQTLLPSDLQAEFWRLRGSIQSVQVHSEEPWIPWELCRLCGEEGGKVVEGPFLGEAFAVTRWIRGIPEKPMLKLRKLALVIPEDSGLPFAADERHYIESLAGSNREVCVIPATFGDITAMLAQGIYDGWHFSGHGSFGTGDPNRSAIYLRGNDPLTPEDLNGEVSNLGLADPLVFLNACQVGRSGMSLTGTGGWASQFLRAGAAAFVGTYWSVFDESALRFAQQLYNGLLVRRLPIGQAAREARLAVREMTRGDPTWLAYTVFANPIASVTAD